ncbi:PAS domain-containing protein, partial [Ensifer sp. BRP08]|nr:PAS domain-containing protein [Ensifer sp. BRP08]
MSGGNDSAGNAGDAGQRFGLAGLAEAIVETLDQPLLILTSNLTTADVNSAYCETFGVTAEETRGQPIYRLGNGQWDIPELRRLLEQVLPERTLVKGYRIEHKFPNIGRRVMILNARRIEANDGRPALILLTVSDRTEAEQARFELEGHREFLEKLIDSVREGLLVLGWDLRVVRANQTFYDLFQVSPADTEGRLVYELGNRQWDIPKLRELLEDVL